MANKLEKQFFDTFEVEPKDRFKGCTLGVKYYSEICKKETCRGCDCEIRGKEYPQITDRILLELEDILLKKYIQIEYNHFSGDYYASCSIALCNGRADNKKDAFLQMLISIAQNYLDNSDIDGEELIYKEVRTLFEEGLN